ncbi:MAG: DNA polymerase III subunit delta' [Alphaproteobacteria bacterium]|nr:DNA polymerase III subunit delta' [Alphaproteobacteria bacterium]
MVAKSKKKERQSEPNIRHPRDTTFLRGQKAAEMQFLQALSSGRMPHAWLINGPKGIGKATLAYRIARYLLSDSAAPSLDVDMSAPAIRRIQNQSHGDLKLLESVGGDVSVEEGREIGKFLSHTPSESQWRVVIIDSVDDMNRNAANAILKTLEEPPSRAVILLISHNPGVLLPTIRSRCRALKLQPLSKDGFADIVREHAPQLDVDMQHAYFALSSGSPGLALFLIDQEALALYHAVLELFPINSTIPDWSRAHKLADQMSGVANTVRFEAMQHVMQYLFCQIIRTSLQQRSAEDEVLEGENAVLLTIANFKSLKAWLDLWQESAIFLQDTRRIHLDRKQVLLNIIASMQPQGNLVN